MPRRITEYRCLLISPSDVHEEREELTDLVYHWNAHVGEASDVRVELVRWESHSIPEMGRSPQEIINAQLVDDCDLGIAVFWSRLGTPTAEYPSGSVEEVYRLTSRGARVMVYFKGAPIPQTNLGSEQFGRLQQVKSEFQRKGLLSTYNTTADLREKVQMHLTSAIMQLSRSGQPSKTESSPDQTSTAPKPDVRVSVFVSLAFQMGLFARDGYERLISIKINNCSLHLAFISSIFLRTKDGRTLWVAKDAATETYVQRKRLEAGEGFTISFDPEKVQQLVPLNELQTAFVTDDEGREFFVDEEEFRQAIESYLAPRK